MENTIQCTNYLGIGQSLVQIAYSGNGNGCYVSVADKKPVEATPIEGGLHTIKIMAGGGYGIYGCPYIEKVRRVLGRTIVELALASLEEIERGEIGVEIGESHESHNREIPVRFYRIKPKSAAQPVPAEQVPGRLEEITAGAGTTSAGSRD